MGNVTRHMVSVSAGGHALRMPVAWPDLPQPHADTRCDLCSWAWVDQWQRLRIKYIHRQCHVHGRFLGR